MRFPRYQKYKDSGAEWIGQLPAHWEADRLKWSVTSCKNGIWGDDPKGDDVLCVRVADFDRTKLVVNRDIPTFRNLSASERERYLLEPGDLLLEKSGGGDKQPVGCVVLFEHNVPAVYANFIARIRPAEDMCPSFWRYVHCAGYDIGLNIPSIKQTSGIQNLDQQSYLDELAPFPPYDEQKQVAEFLDHETAKIDALIEEQQRLIELLEEKRQAVISHAVTKGLDPDAPMKDSGVEWLGEVPEHWDVVKIKRVAKLETGHTPSKSVPEYWENCSVPWVSLNDSKILAAQDYIEDTTHKINEAGLANSSAHILPAQAVVFTRDATIGLAAITKKPMAVSQHLIAWVCGSRILPEYLLLALYAMEQELHRATFGATIKTIGMPEVNRMVTPVPPIEEQTPIVKEVFEKRQQLGKMRLEAEKAVMLLKERRSALISAAVTGKIDVRNWRPEANPAENLPMTPEEPVTYEANEQ